MKKELYHTPFEGIKEQEVREPIPKKDLIAWCQRTRTNNLLLEDLMHKLQGQIDKFDNRPLPRSVEKIHSLKEAITREVQNFPEAEVAPERREFLEYLFDLDDY